MSYHKFLREKTPANVKVLEWWHTFASSWNRVAMMKVVSIVAHKAWITSDASARNELDVFHSIYPQANSIPAPIPVALLDLLLIAELDWTSWSWVELWNDIFTKD